MEINNMTNHSNAKTERDIAKVTAIDLAYGVVEFDIMGNIIQANEIFCSMSGYEKNELQSTHHVTLLTKGQTEYHYTWWENILEGKIKNGNFVRKKKNGDFFWIDATYTRILDNKNSCIGIIKLAQNTTEKTIKLIEEKNKYKAINISQGIIEFDAKGYIISSNRNYQEMCNFEEQELTGMHHSELCHDEFKNSKEYDFFWKRLNDFEFISGSFERRKKNGDSFWIQATYCPLKDMNGSLYKVIKYAHDISDEVLNKRRAARMRGVLDLLLCVHDEFLANHNISRVLKKIAAGISDHISHLGGGVFIKESNNKGWNLLLGVESITKNKEILEREIDNNLTKTINRENKGDDAIIVKIESNGTVFAALLPVYDNNRIFSILIFLISRESYRSELIALARPILKTIGVMLDFKKVEKKRISIKNKNTFNANHDHLTSMYNRRYFFSYLNDEIKDGQYKTLSIAIIDIDNFKLINDRHGHLTGDTIIKEVSKKIRKTVRRPNICARFGGEEFIISFFNKEPHDVFLMVEEIRKSVESTSVFAVGRELKTTISAGVSSISGVKLDHSLCISVADEMLYSSKRNGKNMTSLKILCSSIDVMEDNHTTFQSQKK